MIIDAHNHLGKRKGVEILVDNFVARMDESGIDKAVVFAFSEQIDNDYIVKSVKKYPDRLYGLVTINPWSTDSEQELRKAFEKKEIYGLKLHPVKHAFAFDNHNLLDPLFKICEEYNKPVLSFGGANVYSSPNMFAEMAVQFPNVNFLMAHGGQMYETVSAINVAKKYKNIFIESSLMFSLRLSNLLKNDLENQIIFGSDYPTGDFSLEKKKIELLVENQEIKDKIFYKNILNLLESGVKGK